MLYRTSVLTVVVLFAFAVIFMKFFNCHVTRLVTCYYIILSSSYSFAVF